MPDEPANQQNQSQSQDTAVQVTIQNSSDPALERRIFGKVASAGRQIGRIADVLDILIVAFERNTHPEPTATATIAAYRNMREEIAREKEARTPGRYIEALETLRSEDPKAYAELLPRLRQWLNQRGRSE